MSNIGRPRKHPIKSKRNVLPPDLVDALREAEREYMIQYRRVAQGVTTPYFPRPNARKKKGEEFEK